MGGWRLQLGVYCVVRGLSLLVPCGPFRPRDLYTESLSLYHTACPGAKQQPDTPSPLPCRLISPCVLFIHMHTVLPASLAPRS